MTIKINGDNTVANPGFSGDDTDTGLQVGTNELKLVTGGSEAVTVDSSQRVGVGTTSPSNKLEVNKNGTVFAVDDANFRVNQTAASWTSLDQRPNPILGWDFKTGPGDMMYMCSGGNGPLSGMMALVISDGHGFKVGKAGFDGTDLDVDSSNEFFRINTSGNLYVNTIDSTLYNNNSSGGEGFTYIAGGDLGVATWQGTVAYFNRMGSDGTIISLRQAGNQEGTISVSGSTISYNGGHLSRWSQLAGGAERTEILRGSVLSNLDEMCEWGEENNEQLNRMKVSDVEGDVNVSGVFQSWDDDDDTYTNDFYCAMTGDFIIRIAQGTTVARGDLLMSAGDGTAKPQGDDIVRSKTIAKVTSTVVSETYADGSYCVPCVLMAC